MLPFSVGVQGICPDGWHIPSHGKWSILADYLSANSQYYCDGDPSQVEKSLANTSGWTSHGITCSIGNDQGSNNASGFTVLPAGYRGANGSFNNVGDNANFWSSSENNLGNSWSRNLNYNNTRVNVLDNNQANRFLVRCLQN